MAENSLARSIFEVDGRDLFVEAERRGGDLLVVLGTASCGACKRLWRLLETLQPGQVGGGDFAVADVEATHAMGLVEDWEVFHLPAMMLLRDGEPWARVQAPLEQVALGRAIRTARSGELDPNI